MGDADLSDYRRRLARAVVLPNGDSSPGIPVDMAPYEALCRARNHRGMFEVILNREPEIQRVFLQDGPRLDAIHLITEDRGRVVRALVAKNPFFRGRVPVPTVEGKGSLNFLGRDENIICSVKDMHSPESKFDYYYITEIWTLPMAIREAIEIRCTWNRCLDPRPRPSLPQGGLSKVMQLAAREARRKKRRPVG